MNNYFCVLPFFGYEFYPTGPGTHCCLLPKKHSISDIRNDMLAGKRNAACSACWKLEDSGLISDRILKNSALDRYWNKDIRYIEDAARQGNYSTLLVKYATSNTCNATCVSCGSQLSSAWAKIEKKINIVPYPTLSMSIDQINQDLNFKEIVGLNLMGGEPLYEKLNFYILEKLIEHDNAGCFIQITTNGSVQLSDSHKDLIKQFKNLNFGISIDGVGPVFEYLRYPLKWNNLLENLDFFRTLTDNISVGYTTSNLNILYHHETTQWFAQQKLPYHFNPIINPSYLRPAALPESIKDQIFEKYGRTDDLEFFFSNPHTKEDDTDFVTMLEKIKLQDAAKGISIADYLPEFWNLIQSPV
jgi:sulfatase maturation enzyme AslB (radical SAM superfamily)